MCMSLDGEAHIAILLLANFAVRAFRGLPSQPALLPAHANNLFDCREKAPPLHVLMFHL